MGRTAYASESLLNYLTSLAKPTGYTIGLILGQSCGQKDYVVHLARSSAPSKKDIIEESLISDNSTSPQDCDDNTTIKSINDIPVNWVADHAKHVTRMLPGGMWVLGIFTISPEDIFASTTGVGKLKSILSAVQKNLSSNEYLYGNNSEESLILNLNSITQKYVCKSLDISSTKGGILKPADWKFQSSSNFTKWHQLETLVDFERLFPIERNETPLSLKKQLQDILKETSQIINSSLVIIEGESRSIDDTIETIGKQQQLPKDKNTENSNDSENEEKILQVGLFIPCEEKNSNLKTNKISCSSSIRLVGQLVSRTFVHQKATIDEAINAVKQDIMRSLASRLEMHWDSLIEEEDGSPEETVTLHEPPRRVLVQLPESKVTFSDYLFPGEGAQESLFSLRELLDLQQVTENNIQKDLELQVDPSEFYCQNTNQKISEKEITNQNILLKRKKRTLIFISGLSFAFLIAIIAIIMNRVQKTNFDNENV